MELLWLVMGFGLASYSVIANDSVQTLGTWIASNKEHFNWKTLWAAASSVLLWAIWYSWFTSGGDISYGRLTQIPYVEIQWYHALAPGLLVLLTRFGVPVSTSFLVLSAFASTIVLEKILMKSVAGYAIAALVAYVVWYAINKYFSNQAPVKKEHEKRWRVAQWTVTGFLWWTWLSHDMANMAVFLPREVPLTAMFLISALFVGGLGYMFYEKGGKIQGIIQSKHATSYVRSATMIDLVYLLVLYVFKEWNNIPMSTTWVFIGLLSGRELAHASFSQAEMSRVFPIIAKDFFKLVIGVICSLAVILTIHTLT